MHSSSGLPLHSTQHPSSPLLLRQGSSTMSKRSRCSAQMVPDDVLVDNILSRLPTKTLRRFHCVSKGWSNFISHVFSHRKTLLPAAGLFVYPSKKPTTGKYVPIAPDPHHFGEKFRSRLKRLPCRYDFHIIHSCNGLLLFTRTKQRVFPCLYYVWNPATSECVALPELAARPVDRMDSALAYHPCDSPHYKVLRFTLLKPTSADIRVDIYSSKARSWSNFSVPGKSPLSIRCWLPFPVFHEGALYFLASIRPNLIRFDIEKESFNLVEILENKFECRSACLGESRGHLYYGVDLSGQSIYMLNDLDTKWQLMYKINTKNDVPSSSRLLAFHPESDVVYLNLTTLGKIHSYHPGRDNFEEVHTFDNSAFLDWNRVFFVIPCLESLDPPGGKLINPFNLEKTRGRQSHFSEITSSSRGPRRNATIPMFSHDLYEAPVQNGAVSRPCVPSTNLNEQVVSSPNASLNHDSAQTSGKICVSQPTSVNCGDTNRGKSIEEAFHAPAASRVTRPATCLQCYDNLIPSSSRVPQSDDVDPTFDYGLQVAIEASLQTPVDLSPTVPSSNLNKQIASSAYLSPEENNDSVLGDPGRGNSIEESSDDPLASGVTCRGSLFFSGQDSNSLLLEAFPAELEDFLFQLKSNALMPFVRPIERERNDTELAEEWADVCSQVLGITSYLAIAKAEVKPKKLASRLDNLKALNNSFDCSALIRCFDCLMDYVHVIEGNNLDTINSDLHRGYFSTSSLHEQKKVKIAKKAMLVDTAAAEVTKKIAALELNMQSTRDGIMELRKCLSVKEAQLNSMGTSLDIEKQKEAALVNEKALLAIEQTALELEGKELEDRRVKISAEAKFSMEKIRNLVKQLILSLSKFDLMGSSFPWKKE